MTARPRNAPKRRSTGQAYPRTDRSFGGYIRNGKVVAVVLLLLASWLLYTTLTSPRYVVQHIVLQGGSALSQADVETLAQVQGTPVWGVRPGDVEARVAQSPYVEQVHARVVLPATVVVDVRERQPAMRWQVGTTVYDVAQDGRILAAVAPSPAPSAQATNALTTTATISGTDSVSATASASPSLSAPTADATITILDTTPNRVLNPGDYVDPDALEAARRITLRAADLPLPLQRIVWQQNFGVVAVVGGRTVVVGKSERLDEKWAVLVQLLRENTPFSFLDLRPMAPYWR